MSNYFIGIGGTGAKCGQSLIHLAAAGLLPADTLHTLFIDVDENNGSLQKQTLRVLDNYIKCHGLDRGNVCDIFKTPIKKAVPLIWSPLNTTDNPDMQTLFRYDTMRKKGDQQIGADLLDILYSNKEKTTSLKLGFRGHPSIGAAVLANEIDLQKPPWDTLIGNIETETGGGNQVKIFICGSIFGGMGASGLPTIARIIRERFKTKTNVFISAGLILPYFTFDDTQLDNDKPNELHAYSSLFIPNAKVALGYYHTRKFSDTFNTIYVIGDEPRYKARRASLGGTDQENDPHFVELYAALAGRDFYQMQPDNFANFQNQNTRIGVIGRDNPMQNINNRQEPKSDIIWSDLSTHGNCKDALLHLTRFSIAFRYFYSDVLPKIDKTNKQYYPWYVDLLEKNNFDLSQNAQEKKKLDDYCEMFLKWVSYLHRTVQNTKPITDRKGGHTTEDIIYFLRLVRDDIFAYYDIDAGVTLKDIDTFEKENGQNRIASISSDIDSLVIDERSFHKIWDYVCKSTQAEQTTEFGIFVRALYDACVYYQIKL